MEDHRIVILFHVRKEPDSLRIAEETEDFTVYGMPPVELHGLSRDIDIKETAGIFRVAVRDEFRCTEIPDLLVYIPSIRQAK